MVSKESIIAAVGANPWVTTRTSPYRSVRSASSLGLLNLLASAEVGTLLSLVVGVNIDDSLFEL